MRISIDARPGDEFSINWPEYMDGVSVGDLHGTKKKTKHTHSHKRKYFISENSIAIDKFSKIDPCF